MKRHFALFLLIFPLFSQQALGSRPDSLGVVLIQRLDSLLGANPPLLEETQLGLYVYDLTADTVLYSHGSRQRLRPASTQKLFTAVTALTKLGGDYRFHTTLSAVCDTLHCTNAGGADTLLLRKLIVRGGMDPTLGADDVNAFAEAVRALGKSQPMITPGEGVTLLCDLSFKDSLRWGSGWCWDDDETPLVPLLYGKSDTFSPQFINALETPDKDGNRACKVGNVEMSFVPVKAPDTKAAGADKATLLLERSTDIDDVLFRMMKRSDNQYAESLFYQLGSTAFKAADCVKTLLRSLGADAAAVNVADGSGLSLYNYTTPETLVLLLRYAWRTPSVYRHLQPSLPLSGHDGTLSGRMTEGPALHNVMAKTGSVTGVSTLAGYALADNGHMLAFAIMNQGLRKSSVGRDFQDEVCQVLCAPLSQTAAEEEKNTEETLGDPLPLPAEADDDMSSEQ